MEHIFIEAIKKLGLQNSNICVHSSIKSFGEKVAFDVNELVDAFLKQECTLLVPTFTYENETCPVPKYSPLQNGIGDGSYYQSKKNLPPKYFDKKSKELSTKEMGIFSKTVLENRQSIRGNNYINSFTALGKNAEKLVKNQTNKDVYAPLKQLCEDDGYVLLMGVDLNSATIIHYAEKNAGRRLFVRWAYDKTGKVIPIAVGSCSEGFEKLSDALKDYKTEVTVGNSKWTCYKAKDIVKVCTKQIKNHPEITHCGEKNCDRCNDMLLGGPILNNDFWTNGI